MHWIEKLEEYYDDIPLALRSEVRSFLDEYYEKKETHSAFGTPNYLKRRSDVKRLSDGDLKEILYFDWDYSSLAELPERLVLCENLKVLRILSPISNFEVISY